MSTITTVGAPPPFYEERLENLTRDYAQVKASLTRSLATLKGEEATLHSTLRKLEKQRADAESAFQAWKAAWADHKNSQYKEKRAFMENKLATITNNIAKALNELTINEQRQKKAHTVLAGAIAATTEIGRTTAQRRGVWGA
jgi:DNA repair exonuclease SbcCD ATPase subunit